ncbi:MAG: hypothetical protein IT383_20050 [Deltaproteobacteria bacterium]|nr:hypothetical protein [Deltaproteobacteria bacterium]
MKTPMDDQALEALLKDDGHIDDAGFAERVTARLPRRRRLQRRDLVVAGSALVAGGAGAAIWFGTGVSLEMAIGSWVHAAALAMGVGLALWGALGAAQAEG